MIFLFSGAVGRGSPRGQPRSPDGQTSVLDRLKLYLRAPMARFGIFQILIYRRDAPARVILRERSESNFFVRDSKRRFSTFDPRVARISTPFCLIKSNVMTRTKKRVAESRADSTLFCRDRRPRRSKKQQFFAAKTARREWTVEDAGPYK